MDEDDLIWILKYINETQNADIVNLSLGINICERYDELYDICKEINAKGTISVSASNSMYLLHQSDILKIFFK